MLLKILGKQLRKKRKACKGFGVSQGKSKLMPMEGMLKEWIEKKLRESNFKTTLRV
jgi:hypothetical protein